MGVSTSSANLFQPHAQQRALVACIAASIALHAGLLVAFPELRGRTAPAPLVLTATLAPAAREPAPAETPPARVEPPRPAPRPRPVARPEPRPEAPRATAAPEPAPEPARPQAPAPQVAEAAPAAPVQAETIAPAVPVWDGAMLQ